MKMTKNPEFVKYASDLSRAQDAVRSSNEDLIKLSQRFGRMMPRLSRLEPSTILSWLSLYNRVKDSAIRFDSDLVPSLASSRQLPTPFFSPRSATTTPRERVSSPRWRSWTTF